MLGRKGGPVETAWATALATPRQGHAAFVVAHQPSLAVKPATLFVNKADIRGDRHAELTWGAAQAGVARGVSSAVSDGVVPAGEVDELLLIAAVWVELGGRRRGARSTRQRRGDARSRSRPAREGSRALEDLLGGRRALERLLSGAW